MLTNDDYLFFVDGTLDAMVGLLRELGDERANANPIAPAGNTPFALATHCIGVMDRWAGELVAGRSIERDRDAEFRASGAVEPLVLRLAAARTRLAADVGTSEPGAPLRRAPDPEDVDLPFGQRQGAALVHLLRELVQHLGQMETLRDLAVTPPG